MVTSLSPALTRAFQGLLRESVREVLMEEKQRCTLVRTVHLIRKILVRDMQGMGAGARTLPGPDPDRKILKI